MLSVSESIASHVIPVKLYSIVSETPVTVSLLISNANPEGGAAPAFGTATSLTSDAGVFAVARIRTETVTAELPNALLGMFVPLTGIHAAPPRLYSMAGETPVII